METILFTVSFVFGTLRLLTFTKLFEKNLIGIINVILPYKEGASGFTTFLAYLDYLIFYACLLIQVYFLISKVIIV